jgi:hypothetical protein
MEQLRNMLIMLWFDCWKNINILQTQTKFLKSNQNHDKSNLHANIKIHSAPDQVNFDAQQLACLDMSRVYIV